MIDENALDLARTVDLPSFLEMELGLTPVTFDGNGRFYLSPFGEEKTPSLHVSYRDGVWLWFDHRSALRTGGDAIALLRRLGYSFSDSVARLSRFNGWYDRGGITRKKLMEPSNNRKEESSAGKLEKALYAREVHARLPDSGSTVKSYFTDRGLAYYPEIEARLFVDFKHSTKYITIPVPYPSDLRGLELREYFPASMEMSADFRKKRKCYGIKSLWVYKRNPRRLLVTESVLDALAGENLFDLQDATLVALNGVGQAAEIERLLKCVKPEEAFVAVDNDGPGCEAGRIIKGILERNRVRGIFPEFNGKDPLRAYLSRMAQPALNEQLKN